MSEKNNLLEKDVDPKEFPGMWWAGSSHWESSHERQPAHEQTDALKCKMKTQRDLKLQKFSFQKQAHKFMSMQSETGACKNNIKYDFYIHIYIQFEMLSRFPCM